jgi:hypothetical protein
VSVSSLKSGALSLVFHVPYESAERAFQVHELQGTMVTLIIDEDGP